MDGILRWNCNTWDIFHECPIMLDIVPLFHPGIPCNALFGWCWTFHHKHVCNWMKSESVGLLIQQKLKFLFPVVFMLLWPLVLNWLLIKSLSLWTAVTLGPITYALLISNDMSIHTYYRQWLLSVMLSSEVCMNFGRTEKGNVLITSKYKYLKYWSLWHPEMEIVARVYYCWVFPLC